MGFDQEEGAIASFASGGSGSGGMSRAAKKRLKKKQKEQSKKKKRKNSRTSSSNNNPNNDGDAESKPISQKKQKKMNLFTDDGSDSGDNVDGFGGELSSMQIADVSKGELEYLASQGVEVTTNKADKKKKSKKKKKLRNALDDGDDMSEPKDDDEVAEEEEVTEEDMQEREILTMLSRNLTPSQVLFPQQVVDDDDEQEEEDSEYSEDADAMQAAAAADPHRIVQDLTSTSRARVLFETLLAPSGVSAEEFYRDYWEKKPLLVSQPKVSFDDAAKGGGIAAAAAAFAADKKKSSQPPQAQHKTRLDNLLSKKDIENMLAKCSLRYGREINVTRYADAGDGSGTKRRVTLDLPPKRIKRKGSGADTEGEEELQHVVADPKDVWSNFSSGCTVRLLCPHLHSDCVHALLSMLELEFGCMVGSNAYLTPGDDSQGFAPHYDDIEAFILQLEGRKRWRVYPPPNRAETLPRFSSRDYTDKDMEGTQPVIDTVLGPGDVLYMPRGWIHQAHTPPSSGKPGHSLHLTASAMQKWAWIDFLELIMPEALEAAAESETSTSLREGLPRNFLNYMGAMYDTNSEEAPEGLKQDIGNADETEDDGDLEEVIRQRKMKRMQDKFRQEANKRIMRVCKEAISMVNAGCDQIGKRFLSDCQPPSLTPNEAFLTSEHRAENGGKVWPNTMCRLVRPGIARLVLEDGKAVLYHCADNSRIYQGSALSPLEFEVDDAPALEMLLTTTEPHWICVKDLIHGDIEDKMEIAQSLYDEGILAIFQADKPERTVQTG